VPSCRKALGWRRATFRSIWSSLYGLLVDDGQLAIGALLALAITWALARAGGDATQDVVGWVLLAMVLVLVVVNLYRAGVVARARMSSARR
jgi:hypothetical protein